MKRSKKLLVCLLCLVTMVLLGAVSFAANNSALPEMGNIKLTNYGKGILIQWDIPENADSFVIVRKAEGEEDFTPLTEVGKKNNYRDLTAVSGVSYTYAVLPYKGAYPGKYSPVASVPCIHQPELINAKATTEGVEVSWKPVEGAEKYTVYYKSDAESSWKAVTHVKSGTTYLHKAAPDGMKLSYTVTARKGSVKSSFSSKGVSVDYLKTPAVTDICSVINGIKITWEKTDAATSYLIYRRGAGQKWTYLTSVSENTYTDTSAQPGKTFAYTVRAVRGSQKSLYTSGKAYRYMPVNDITSVNTLCNGLTLKWKSSPYATFFKLYRKTDGGKAELLTKVSAKTLSYTDKNLTHGKSYTYFLVSICGSYESTPDVIGKTYTFVEAPDAKSAVAKTKGYTVTWEKIEGATNYYIYRRASSSDKWTKIARVNDVQSYNDTTANKTKTYYYCVRAGIGGKYFSNYGDQVKTTGIDPNKKMVALTYDDGPHNTHTMTILDTLEKYGAKATFFVVGERINSNSAPLIRASKLGCEIGNHTYNHMNIPSYSASKIRSNLQQTDDLVRKYTGHNTTVMRPPGGATSSSSLAAVDKPVIMWSVDTRDWSHRSASKTVSHIKSNVFDGAIVLMHDLYEPTASATKTIVPWLIDNGYQLVTVTELLEYRGITPRNGVVYRSATK